MSIQILHSMFGGLDYWMQVGRKSINFEDHPYCGPVVLDKKTGDPLAVQPSIFDGFWLVYDLWVTYGKKTKNIGGKECCDLDVKDFVATQQEVKTKGD